MMDIELFAEGRLRERELYFATPQYKARADWRSGLAALARRRPLRRPAARRTEPQPAPVVLY